MLFKSEKVYYRKGAIAENIKQFIFNKRRTKMKKFKKLIPALCMLLVSAVMLGSTTYAWFSMNKTATASGMNVTATSNEQFFVISNTNTLATETKITSVTKTAGGVTDAAHNITAADNKVYPVAFVSGDAPTGVNKPWYTARSNSRDDHTMAEGTAIGVDTGATDYMLTYTLYIGLSSDSQAQTSKVKVTATITGEAGVAIQIGTTDLMELKTGVAKDTSADIAFTPGEAVEVKIYAFIDGNQETVKSSNTQAITGNIDLQFDLLDPTANG